MKKHLFIISTLLLGIGLSAAAQTQEKRDLLDKIEDMEIGPAKVLKRNNKEYKVFEFSLIDNLGFGLTNINAAEFNPKFGKSYEFFANAFNISVNPTRWLSFDVGGDLKIDSFTPGKNEFFFLDDDRYPIVDIVPDAEESLVKIKKSSSKLLICSLSVPATIGFNFGGFNLRGGAEFFWPLPIKQSFTKTRTETDEGWNEYHQWKARVEKFSWDYMAAISWEGLGLYFKYYPWPLVPASSNATFKYWTAGIVVGF